MARKRAAVGTPALVAVLLLGATPAEAVLPLEMLGLPSPTDVVKLLDLMTKKDSSTSMQVKLGDTVSQGKLLVARMRVEITLDRSSRNWRGRIDVHMTVPSDISYSVDLAAIRPEHIHIDPGQRLLLVIMPDPQVENVTPLLTALKTENTFKRARFRRFGGDACRALQNTLLKEDYQLRARQEGAARLPVVRQQARTALQQLLQTLLQPSCPDIQVRVE